MIETRLAQQGEMQRQKLLWKLCFGDEQRYIDHYYDKLYQPQHTAVLVEDGEIASMLTMLPVSLVLPSGSRLEAAMIYAVATHPDYRGRGHGSKLMQFAHTHLSEQGKALSVLVPATQSLFSFYGNRGYFPAFSLREALLTHGEAVAGPLASATVFPVTPEEYATRRTAFLAGRLQIDYTQEGIAYQKSLCEATGADLYGIDLEGAKGCAVVERLSPQRVIIKELLMPAQLLSRGVAALARLLPAEHYILRTPAWLGGALGGSVRPFAMARWYDKTHHDLFEGPNGYLALAYD